MAIKNSQPITAQTLAGLELFAALTVEERTAIAALMQGQVFEAGESIIAQEDQDCDVYFIVSGVVRVTYFSAKGKEVAFRELREGSMFGELAAIDGERRSAQVDAYDRVFIAKLPRQHFLRLIAENPTAMTRVTCHLAGLVRRLSSRVVEFSTLGVKNRLHAELLRLARETDATANEVRIERFPTDEDIANRISTHREAVNRELNALRRAKLISGKDQGALVVLDVAVLEQMVRDIAGAEHSDGA